jgi:hypothetical protein
MKRNVSLLTMLILTGLASAQTAPRGISTQGDCNGTAIGSNITVIVKCDPNISLDEAKNLAHQYTEILERIRRDNVSFTEVIKKLDSIEKGVDAIKTTTIGRSLSPQQVVLLKTRFAPLDKNAVFLDYYTIDAEAVNYGSQFVSALGLTQQVGRIMSSTNPDVGIILSISDADFRLNTIPPACEVMRQFLTAEKILFQGRHVASASNGSCHIVIGLKPLP